MSDSSRMLLVRGIAAAKAGDKDEARFYLEWVLRTDASYDEQVKAWYWLSEITDDPVQKRDYLDSVLASDPGHPEARRKLALLDGRLQQADIVDANRLPTSEGGISRPADARRFECPQCGARMRYSPEDDALRCEYCGHRQRPDRAPSGSTEQDFVVALSTTRGHTAPVTVHTFSCEGCGKSFVLAPEVLSLTCPHCGSTYAVRQTQTRELVMPAEIIPMKVDREAAERVAREWLAQAEGKGAAVGLHLGGVYLPVWAFDLTGQVGWTCHIQVNQRKATFSGTEPVLIHDVLSPADPLPDGIPPGALSGFDLGQLAPYDLRYLADWPAETYTISVSDASIGARSEALSSVRKEIEARQVGNIESLVLDSSRLYVDSFKLLLVPMWIVRYTVAGRERQTVVNGQTGVVFGRPPARGVLGWLRDMLGTV